MKELSDAQLRAYLQQFVRSSLYEAVVMATKAGEDDGVRVNFFPDGSYEYRYKASQGDLQNAVLVVEIPAFNEEDRQECMEAGMDENEYFALAWANEQDDIIDEIYAQFNERFM